MPRGGGGGMRTLLVPSIGGKGFEWVRVVVWGWGGITQGCMRREGTPEPAPAAVGQAVGGGCRSGWERLLSVINAIESGTCCQGDSAWAWAGHPREGEGLPPPPPSNASLGVGWHVAWVELAVPVGILPLTPLVLSKSPLPCGRQCVPTGAPDCPCFTAPCRAHTEEGNGPRRRPRASKRWGVTLSNSRWALGRPLVASLPRWAPQTLCR